MGGEKKPCKKRRRAPRFIVGRAKVKHLKKNFVCPVCKRMVRKNKNGIVAWHRGTERREKSSRYQWCKKIGGM